VDQGDPRLAVAAALNEPQRQRLYGYIAAQDTPVGRDAAAVALEIPRSVAAFHLEKLVELGLLEVEFRRPPGRSGPGAGRPAKLYRRAGTEISLSIPAREYGVMALLLAQAVQRTLDGAEPMSDALRTVARAYGSTIGAPLRPAATQSRRRKVEGVTQLLVDHGYEPQVTGSTIMLRNCPFHALAEEHREMICCMNLELLRGVVESAGFPEDVAQQEPAPGRCCVSLHP
jgi:predicted ArsR family transcriptional regulator